VINDGTIDVAGFREDLAQISQNTYIGQIGLIKLPMDLDPGVIFQVPLPNPGNHLVLTYEALDAQGNYLQSVPAAGTIVAGASPLLAQGFARFNKQGPWLPISMFSPLMQGLASASPNYTGNPIVGAGFSSLAMPIITMEWQVLAAFQQSGFMLAFWGMNFGLRGGIGNGSGSTYAIPSAAGPIDRLKGCR
jgi:hypothetical protein